ncbi:MAG: hypothetical protein RUDDFDWM_000796 [Candidatus Fervidibacterota bacterium]
MAVLRWVGRTISIMFKMLVALLCLFSVFYVAYFAYLNSLFPVRVVNERMIEFAVLGPPFINDGYYTLMAHVYEMVCLPTLIAIAVTLLVLWISGYRHEEFWRRVAYEREQQLRLSRKQIGELEEALRRHYREYQEFVIRALSAARGELTEGVSEVVMEAKPLPSQSEQALEPPKQET